VSRNASPVVKASKASRLVQGRWSGPRQRASRAGSAHVARLGLVDAVVLVPWITPRTRHMQHLAARSPARRADHRAPTHRHRFRAPRPGVRRALRSMAGPRGPSALPANLAQFDEDHTHAVKPLLPSITASVGSSAVRWRDPGRPRTWLPSLRAPLPLPNSDRLKRPTRSTQRTVARPAAAAPPW